MKKVRVLLADDHVMIRKGLKQFLDATDDIEVVGEASSGKEALEKIANTDVDMLVLDIAMPGMGGFDVLEKIQKKKLDMPTLVLSMYPEEQFAIRILKAGASGYMNKESAPEELVKAIRTVASGKRYLTPNVVEMLGDNLMKREPKHPHEKLSEREFQVLIQVANGKTPTEIAETLSLSIKTISTYRKRILDKMGMKNNSELTHYAISNQLM